MFRRVCAGLAFGATAWLLVIASGCGDDTTITPSSSGTGGAGAGGATGGTGTGATGGGGGTTENLAHGEPCIADESCVGEFCLNEKEAGWPLGYCSELCNQLAPCETPGTTCVDIGVGEFCLTECDPAGSDCAAHQQCFDLGEGNGACGPGCTDDSHCPALGKCKDNGWCVEPEDCADGEDNDEDELTDCEDDDCATACASDIAAACSAAAAATASTSGNTSGGTSLFRGGCTGGGALEQLYTYTAASAGLLHITLDSATDQGVYIRETCDNPASELACSDSAVGGSVESTFMPVTNGQAMTIFVDGYFDPVEAGPFTLGLEVLTIETETEDNGTFGSADPFTDGTVFGASIGTSGDNDWIAVTVPGPTSEIVAEIVGGGADTCAPGGDIDSEIQILDTDGITELAFNDDISGFGNFCSAASAADLVAGTYYVRAAASVAFCADCTYDYNVIIDVN